jgi:hypothetical protein
MSNKHAHASAGMVPGLESKALGAITARTEPVAKRRDWCGYFLCLFTYPAGSPKSEKRIFRIAFSVVFLS